MPFFPDPVQSWGWLERLMDPWMPGWHLEGRENLPRRGAWLLASNHLSPLDPLVWVKALERVPRFVADPCVLRWLPLPVLEALGVIVLPREGARFPVLVREARDALVHGECVAMFPEGLDAFRRPCGARFHRGMAALWERVGPSHIPLIPGALIARQATLVEVPARLIGWHDGTHLVLSIYRDVMLRVGPPVDPPEPFDVETARTDMERAVRDLLVNLPPVPGPS